MKIYTKTGDKGITSLLGGARVLKSDERINAYGTIDELNSYLGLLGDQEINSGRKAQLKEIQDRLFTIGSHLAADPSKAHGKLPDLREEDIQMLEQEMDLMNETLPEMRSFILPGGHQSVSFCHIARCVCRRAERLVVQLHEKQPVEAIIIIYLNRLSDYLFILSRSMALALNAEEVPWKARIL
ncbi:MAG: cob(I)yrinic acid a,c-diamide adenosyltransferase [Bacteroidota bacterium]|nr:cob(I)yrinic acid a,c-diamide adenosyltransferase [Bacteroidota bacterium]